LAKSRELFGCEENILPVLTNSMLVTEIIPIWVQAFQEENLKTTARQLCETINLR
jgi:hypothetical protein